MKQDIETLKNRVDEAQNLLNLIKLSLDNIDIQTIPQAVPGKEDVGYLSVEEAANYLNVSRSNFYKLRCKITISSFQVFGREKFRREDLDQAMEQLRT